MTVSAGLRRFAGMKAVHLIPPALALAVAGAWNGRQARTISDTGADVAVLRREISAAAAEPAEAASKPPIPAPSGRMDMRELAAAAAAMENGGSKTDIRRAVDFQQRLAGMSAAEILAALDDLDALGLSADERGELETMMLERLAEIAPEAALERFAGRAEEDDLGWALAGALKTWAAKDLAAAARWFDGRLAVGEFASASLDGRNEIRGLFEAALVGKAISTNPADAAARLEALPADQRREVLESLAFAELGQREQLAYAEMVRTLVPADERSGSFAHIAGELADGGGIGTVADFLDAAQATPEERAAAARQAAESRLENLNDGAGVTRAAVDELRTWLDRQAPGRTDAITGRALAEAAQGGGDFSYDQAAKMVLDYQARVGGDDVLVAFLKGFAARSNLEEARDLIGKVADPQRRAELMGELEK